MAYRKKRMFKGRRKTGTGRVSKKIKKYVKQAISRDVENKMLIQNPTDYFAISGNNIPLTTAALALPLAYELTPSITQGTSKFTRIGQRVKIKRMLIDAQLMLSGASVTPGIDAPLQIYYAVVQPKSNPGALTSVDLDNLFYTTGGATINFRSGAGNAPVQPLNTDYFNIMTHNFGRKPIKLGYAQYGVTNFQLSNNDYSAIARLRLNLTKHFKKVTTFTAGSNLATNNQWYIAFYVQKNNLDITTASWDPPSCFMNRTMTFEDA